MNINGVGFKSYPNFYISNESDASIKNKIYAALCNMSNKLDCIPMCAYSVLYRNNDEFKIIFYFYKYYYYNTYYLYPYSSVISSGEQMTLILYYI